MLPTAQANAIQFANDMMTLANMFNQVMLLSQNLQSRQTNHSYLSILSAMQTYTQAADGSQPGTADGTPVTTHPLVGLNVSEAQVNALFATMGDFLAFLTGTAAPVQSNRTGVVAALLP